MDLSNVYGGVARSYLDASFGHNRFKCQKQCDFDHEWRAALYDLLIMHDLCLGITLRAVITLFSCYTWKMCEELFFPSPSLISVRESSSPTRTFATVSSSRPLRTETSPPLVIPTVSIGCLLSIDAGWQSLLPIKMTATGFQQHTEPVQTRI